MPGAVACQKELQDRFGGGEVEIERSIDEFELARAAPEQTVHFGEKTFEGELPDRDVE